MNSKTFLMTAIGLALTHYGLPALAADLATDTNGSSNHGVQEVSDEELSTMRGRYTVGNNTVAWFGVSMISSWQSSTGQLLQSTLTVGMNFTGKQPQITFVPTVTITPANAPLPAVGTQTSTANTTANNLGRNVSGLGLTNVGGVVQSVQVAGDNNLASNQTNLTITNGNAPPSNASNNTVTTGSVTTTSNGASATASYDDGLAQVLLNITGEGNVRQWVQNGSLGQTVQLTADNQIVSNLLQVQLVRQAMATNAQLTQNIAQNVSQSINLTRGIGNR
ncbi:MAG: hypothetical protein WA777_05080 [Rhodanobacter sp.]